MIRIFAGLLFVLSFATMSHAADVKAHSCTEEAKVQAAALLRFHYDVATDAGVVLGIDDEVRQLPPVAALVGTGQFDVLELTGYIYRATYRIRLIYAQIPDSCVLMGQEILEVSDPY